MKSLIPEHIFYFQVVKAVLEGKWKSAIKEGRASLITSASLASNLPDHNTEVYSFNPFLISIFRETQKVVFTAHLILHIDW